MMWQTAPMMATAICPSAQATVQPRVMLVPQQAMPVWPQQRSTPETSSPGDLQKCLEHGCRDSAPATQPGTHGVWDGMTAWKARQSFTKDSFVNDKKAFGMDRSAAWNSKEGTSQFSTSSQNTARPRSRNAISTKAADIANSAGPRAVFVDLSKIVPTGVMN